MLCLFFTPTLNVWIFMPVQRMYVEEPINLSRHYQGRGRIMNFKY
jgi:hypothetical protein